MFIGKSSIKSACNDKEEKFSFCSLYQYIGIVKFGLRYNFACNMVNVVKKIRKYIATGFLLLVVVLFSFNKVYYVHSHIQANGVIVIHAHPFNKSTDNGPIKSHHHSNSDLYWISSLHILWLLAFLTLGIVCFRVLQVLVVPQKSFSSYACCLYKNGRAPPVSSYLF